jgi:hypothetical protein
MPNLAQTTYVRINVKIKKILYNIMEILVREETP